MKKESIMYEIAEYCKDKSLENVKKLRGVIDKLEDSITPYELLNSLVSYMESDKIQDDKSYDDLTIDVIKAIAKSKEIKELKENRGSFDVGLALLSIGMKMMDIDFYGTHIIDKKLDDNTFTEDDAKELVNHGVIVQSKEVGEKMVNFIDNLEKDKDVNKKDAAAIVTDCNKEEALKLIENGRMSIATIKELMNSNTLTLKDLVNGLSEHTFYDIISQINGVEEKIEVEEDRHSDIPQEFKDVVESGDRKNMIMTAEKLSESKEDLAKYMKYVAEFDPNIDDAEKKIRENIKNNVYSDDEIVKLVIGGKINPYFLEICGMPKDRVNKIGQTVASKFLADLPNILGGIFEDE